MTDTPNQPREYDAVLGGGQILALPPVDGAVLGGIAGLKHRFSRCTAEEKIETLSKALTYGEAGLDLVIQALGDYSEPVRWQAYAILREQAEPRIKRVLTQYLPTISPGEIDCSRLGGLLAVGNWQEADKETAAIMLKAGGRENGTCLKLQDIERFSGKLIKKIDRLWDGCSNGKFGLQVQASIWQSVVGNGKADYSTWYRFCDRVEWRVKNCWIEYNRLQFNLNAPSGHLPFLPVGGFGVDVCLESLFQKLKN